MNLRSSTVAPLVENLPKVDVRRDEADVTVPREDADHRAWNAEGHVPRLSDGWNEVVLFRGEKERRSAELMESVPDVVRREQPQPTRVAVAARRRHQFHEALEFGDDVVIGAAVHMSGHTVEGGVLRTAGVRLGRHVTVRVGSVIDIDVEAGHDCQVGP